MVSPSLLAFSHEPTIFWRISSSVGFSSLGVVSLGVVSLGVVSLGVVSLGVVSLGVVSLGVVSLGVVSLGVVSFGVVSLGVVSLGVFVPSLQAASETSISTDKSRTINLFFIFDLLCKSFHYHFTT
ncbi:MAG: hypothetical protein IKJ80_00960 [Clostridia bacterium]|nr:hypothetical protein [Clostridia bacterium]